MRNAFHPIITEKARKMYAMCFLDIVFGDKILNAFLNTYKFIPVRMFVLILFLILCDIRHCGEQCNVIVRIKL
jgi:hypothetical protein